MSHPLISSFAGSNPALPTIFLVSKKTEKR